MVTKLQGSSTAAIRAPKAQTAKAPAKPAAKATTAKGSWGASGAAKTGKVTTPAQGAASQVKLLKAKIDEGVSGDTRLTGPKGYTIASEPDKQTVTAKLADGKTATLQWDSATLSAKGPDGKTMVLRGKDVEGFKGVSSDFTDNCKATTKEDLAMGGPMDWDSSRGFSGFGSAGKMLSITESNGDFTGGAHPNFGTQLQTFDLKTGRQVKLDELLTKEQFKSIVDTISTSLPKMKGPDDIEGSSFMPVDVADAVKNNFGLTTDAKGNPQIVVAFESGIHALGGTQANFTFAAPTDAAFKAKIGLE